GGRAKQCRYAEAGQQSRRLAPQRRAATHARLQRYASAPLLARGHQRKRENRSPQQPVAKLTSDLGVRPDPARVVVAGSGDQSRTQHLEETERPVPSSFLDV